MVSLGSQFRKLGKYFQDGEVVFYQGDKNDDLYIIQEGNVELSQCNNKGIYRTLVLGKDDIFGVTSLSNCSSKTATARALDIVRVIKLDKKQLVQRMHTDPALSFRILTQIIKRFPKMVEAV
jgi:CRP-like cAMP-binding protein